ncbi:MAG: hypothetical protein C4558_00245 [Dehalococcoidia bacterium]|nr:MAG: hypothetical protein C4558_00245 [Dehalococcoidia bacterium]
MKERHIQWWSVVAGALLALTGAVWALQGAGVLGGSVMSNDTQWLVVGILVAALGVWLARRGVTRP